VPQNQRPAFLQNRESEEFLGKIEKLQHFPIAGRLGYFSFQEAGLL
jgi:hypothetical protein